MLGLHNYVLQYVILPDGRREADGEGEGERGDGPLMGFSMPDFDKCRIKMFIYFHPSDK